MFIEDSPKLTFPLHNKEDNVSKGKSKLIEEIPQKSTLPLVTKRGVLFMGN
jgi:hypothetical protein